MYPIYRTVHVIKNNVNSTPTHEKTGTCTRRNALICTSHTWSSLLELPELRVFNKLCGMCGVQIGIVEVVYFFKYICITDYSTCIIKYKKNIKMI